MGRVIEIPRSKRKMGLLLVGALAFVVLGILFVINPEQWVSARHESTGFIRIAGGVSVLFFGGCSFFIAKHFLGKGVGLRIDEKGITDHTNATSVGLIEWQDITGIQRLTIASSNILIIKTAKPEKYIRRATNSIARAGHASQ
jgi:multisubunit Na+/H+ antiporter MnhB subunit